MGKTCQIWTPETRVETLPAGPEDTSSTLSRTCFTARRLRDVAITLGVHLPPAPLTHILGCELLTQRALECRLYDGPTVGAPFVGLIEPGTCGEISEIAAPVHTCTGDAATVEWADGTYAELTCRLDWSSESDILEVLHWDPTYSGPYDEYCPMHCWHDYTPGQYSCGDACDVVVTSNAATCQPRDAVFTGSAENGLHPLTDGHAYVASGPTLLFAGSTRGDEDNRHAARSACLDTYQPSRPEDQRCGPACVRTLVEGVETCLPVRRLGQLLLLT